MQLDIDLENLAKEVKKMKGNKAILQIPDGIKLKAMDIVKYLEEKSGKKIYLSIETVYGACDIAIYQKQAVNADFIIHLGHSKFVKYDNVIYWPMYYKADKEYIEKAIKSIEEKLKNKKISIVGPVQYLKIIKEIIKNLKNLEIIKGKKTFLLNEYQLLGCSSENIRAIAKEIDAVVYIGDGKFHIEALPDNVKVYNFDGNSLKEFKIPNEEKRKIISKSIYKEAKKIGILVSIKIGQNKHRLAEKVYERAKKEGKEAFLLIADYITYDKIIGLKLDCLINTACPRLIDDRKKFSVPLIDVMDLY